jgi:hypothetical protein
MAAEHAWMLFAGSDCERIVPLDSSLLNRAAVNPAAVQMFRAVFPVICTPLKFGTWHTGVAVAVGVFVGV